MEAYTIYLPLYEERVPDNLEDFARDFSQYHGFFMQVTKGKVTFLQTFSQDISESCKTYTVPLKVFANPKGQPEVSAISAFASRFNRMSSLAFTHVKDPLRMIISIEENTTKRFKGAKRIFVATLEYDSSLSLADASLLRL